MILEHGNMWDVFGKTDLFIITTNSFIKANRSLVMGRGIALEARTKIPNIDFKFGNKIAETCGHLGKYGLIIVKQHDSQSQSVGAFQVKRHFQDKADGNLIAISTLMLKQLADKYTNYRFDINFPAIGFGKLKVGEVMPIISSLPDNVHVWQFK